MNSEEKILGLGLPEEVNFHGMSVNKKISLYEKKAAIAKIIDEHTKVECIKFAEFILHGGWRSIPDTFEWENDAYIERMFSTEELFDLFLEEITSR